MNWDIHYALFGAAAGFSVGCFVVVTQWWDALTPAGRLLAVIVLTAAGFLISGVVVVRP